MIWQSIFLMTVVDVLILGIVGYSAAVFLGSRRRWTARSSQNGFFTILGGLSLVALFYLADLLVMHVVPGFMPRAEAMAIMRELHLNGSWLVALLGIGTICFGFTSVNRATAALLDRLEAREGDLARNLAERKQIEQTQRDSEERFRTVLDSLPSPVFLKDTEGRYLFANKAFEQRFGLKFADMAGKTYEDVRFAKEETARAHLALEREVLETREAIERELPIRRADGTIGTGLVIRFPVFGADGDLIAVGCSINTDITERKRTEATFRELNARSSAFLDNVPEAISLKDVDGHYFLVNAEFERLVGLSSDEIHGKTDSELMPWAAEISTAIAAHDRAVLESGTAITQERDNVLPDGSTRSWIVTKFPVLDVNGDVVAIGTTNTDITERKRAEEEVRDSRDRIRLIADNLPVAIAYFDAEQRFQFVNRTLAEWYSCPPEEMLGRNMAEVVRQESYDRIKRWLELALAGEEQHYENVATYPDGKTRTVDIHYVPHIEESGTVRGCFALARDITERKRAEAALRESEELLRLVTDAIPALISYVDTDRRYRFANQEYERRFGIAAEDMIGRKMDEVLGPQTYGRLKPHIDKALSGEEVTYIDDAVDRVGNRWYTLETRVPHFDDSGGVQGMVTVAHDITEFKRAEEALRESETELDEALEAMSEGFAYFDAEDRLIRCNTKHRELFPSHAEFIVPGARFEDLLRKQTENIELPWAVGREEEWIAERVEEHRNPGEPRERVFADGRVIRLSEYKTKSGGVVSIRTDITELKETEKALRDSRDQIRLITDNLPAGISYLDSEQRYRFVNRTLEEWYDRPAEEILGRTLGDILGKEVQDRIGPSVDATLKGKAQNYEHVVTHPDGKTRVVDVIYVPHIDGSGTVRGCFALVQDITERMRAEAALRESEALFRSFIDNLPNEIFVRDTTGRFALVNRAWEKIQGVSSEEAIGKTVYDIFSKDKADIYAAQDRAVLETGQVLDRELEFREGNGSHFLHTIKFPIPGADGEVTAIGGISADITERKRAEQALRQSEQRFKDIANSSADWFWELDENGRYTYISERYQHVTGIDPQQGLGKTQEEILKERQAPPEYEAECREVSSYQRERKPYRDIRFKVLLPDGRVRHWRASGWPVFDDKGGFKGYRGATTDVTDEVMAEQARRESESLFRALVDNLPVEIAMRDTKGRYLLVNHAWEKAVGRRNEDVIGGTLYDVFAKAEADLYMAQDRAVLATGRVVDEEVEVPREGAVEFLHMIKFPIPDARGDIASIGAIITDITERKQAEAALRESEERFRTLVEHAPEAITMLDVDTGLYVDANPMAEALHGLPRDELIGKIGPADLSPEIQPGGRPSSEAAPDYLSRALAGEFPRFEWMHLAADGQETPCEVFLARLPDPHRNLVRASIFDITERKQAEAALRESEARLSKAAEMAKIGYWVWDEIEDKAVFCSEELAKMHDVASGEELAAILSSHAADLEWLHPEDRERFEQATREARALKCGLDIECRIIDSKGKTRHVHIIEEPILDEHGGIIRSNGIAQDITESKRAEEALRQSEQRFKDIANSSADWFWELDENFRFTYFSDRYQQVTGIDPKQVLGKTRKEIREDRNLPAEYEAEYRELDSYYRERKPYRDLRYKVLLPDGRVRHWRASGQPLFGEKGEFRGYRGSASDVTDEVRAEEALSENRAQLRQAQKMEALGQLAGGTAHEINNLLQPIITFAKLTRDEVEDPEHRHYLDRVLECGRRAKEIVSDILIFARKAPGKPEAIEVRELMTATVRFVRDLIPSTIELRPEIMADTGRVLVNRTEFTQVIINLAQNAADAIDRAGTVSITAKIVDLGGHRAIQRHLSDGRYCRVSVKDTGSGMTEETLKRIFEPFFTTKAASKGTGLGLSVVYGIVTGWGGSVSADSVVGEGSVFDVYIPLMQESAIPSRGLRHDAHTDR